MLEDNRELGTGFSRDFMCDLVTVEELDMVLEDYKKEVEGLMIVGVPLWRRKGGS